MFDKQLEVDPSLVIQPHETKEFSHRLPLPLSKVMCGSASNVRKYAKLSDKTDFRIDNIPGAHASNIFVRKKPETSTLQPHD